MFARFVRTRVRPGALHGFRGHYEDRIAPTLAATGGCRAAALLQHVPRERDILSLTLWSSARQANDYDREGRFARLLNESDDYLGDEAAEGPPAAAPADDLAVEGYEAELVTPADLGPALASSGWARTATARVEPERLEEFDRRYRAESLEALDFPGLRSVLLLHRHGRPTEAVGLSFWDGEEAAARYELSGRFEGLAARLDDTLVPLHRWRAGLAGASGGAGWVAPTLEVAGYRVLFSRTF